jgi:lipopolysaccharide export system permease protein
MTTPMSVLVATLYAFSRLAAENEITAMKANGVSLKRLLIPVLIAASFISLTMIVFNDRVLPASNHKLRQLQGDIARKKPTFGLREQIINQVADRQVYLKAMKLGTDNRMTDVTIYDLSDVMRRRTIYADSGKLAFAPNGKDLVLTLYNGATIEVPRAEPLRLQRASFDQNFVRVEGVANQLEMTRSDSYKSDREMTICELQNDVSRYEAEYVKARTDLRDALLAVTNEALTGKPANPPEISSVSMFNVMPGSVAPRSPNASLGRAYCDVTVRQRPATSDKRQATSRSSLFAARPLYAGTVATQDTTPRPQPPVQAIVVPVDSTRPPVDSVLSNVIQTGTPGVTQQMPITLSGTVDNARIRMRDNQRFVNQANVELHKKFAISVACVVFVLVGAPIALRFPLGGVGLVIGVSIAIFGIYYVGLIAGEALADRNLLRPSLAMWAANIFLTIVGIFLLARMGRETATTRGGGLSELLEAFRGTFRRQRPARVEVR